MPPAKPPMRGRYIKVPDPLWHAAQKVAAERGESVSEAIRRDLEMYVRRHQEQTRNS